MNRNDEYGRIFKDAALAYFKALLPPGNEKQCGDFGQDSPSSRLEPT
jgi:hypothetical protein